MDLGVRVHGSVPVPMNHWLSLQDPFPKGVIPLTAIEMTRSSKDNKFQVITGQRVFVFRTESEGEGQGLLGQDGKRRLYEHTAH